MLCLACPKVAHIVELPAGWPLPALAHQTNNIVASLNAWSARNMYVVGHLRVSVAAYAVDVYGVDIDVRSMSTL